VTVYRGVSLPRARAAEMLLGFRNAAAAGAEVRAAGFQSASLDRAVAEAFAAPHSVREGVVLEIGARRGFYMEGSTRWKGEHEMILGHGSRFRVLGVDEATGTGRAVVRLEQLP
jgi:hypothetical protein